jgi:hypothetical protein
LPTSHECRLVWDDTQRNAVACVDKFSHYACLPGEPCVEVRKAVPNCGRVSRTVCAPKEMFKDIPNGGSSEP